MVDFPSYFNGMEARLRADLESIRAATTHSGNKGDKAEQAFREFLNDHLPRSIEVGHGEVIDQAGHKAGIRGGGEHQIDVLLVDDCHPRFGNISEPNTYFIEGILAAGEVKSSLQMGQVETIFKQATAFKKLRTKPGKGDIVQSNDTDIKRFVDRRPYFLFAYEATVSPQALLNRLRKLENEHDIAPTDHLDAIFFLGDGALLNLGDGTSSFGMSEPNGKDITGWGRKKTDSLLSLIAWLSAVMPNILHLSSVTLPYIVKQKPSA